MNGRNKLLTGVAATIIVFGTGCVPAGPSEPSNWYFDNDLDGYGDPTIVESAVEQPNQYVANNRDCNDTDETINPGATEIIGDSIDNDCDDQIDEIAIGNIGLAGGIVFYVDGTGEHGLEVAPVDQGVGEWGCMDIVVPGADGTAIGTGAQNTADMLAANCSPYWAGNALAADLVSSYSLNGFDDWFLPSRDELDALHTARHVVGGFSASSNSLAYYLSSSEYSVDNVAHVAWIYSFDYGQGGQGLGGKNTAWRVRAIRAF